MDSYYDYSHRNLAESPKPFPSWSTFVLGAVLTFLLVYVGVARPLTIELANLRGQVQSLQSAVDQVAGHAKTAGEASTVLAALADQAGVIQEAKSSLKELHELQQHLIGESRETQNAISAVAELAALKDTLLANATRASEAANVMATSELIYDRLSAASDSSLLALEVGNNLLMLGEELVLRGHDVEAANSTLQSLVQMRESLQREENGIQVARNRVADLLNLKDAVVAQTDDLADAIATLELTADLNAQFDQAHRTFEEIRMWMVEVVSNETLLQRARYALEPLTDLVNLRRLQPEDLREMARNVSEQFQQRVARKPSTAGTPQSATRDSGGSVDALEPLAAPPE